MKTFFLSFVWPLHDTIIMFDNWFDKPLRRETDGLTDEISGDVSFVRACFVSPCSLKTM